MNLVPPKLKIRASKNLTPEQISNSSFYSSMNMIEEVARTGEGCILGKDSTEASRDKHNDTTCSRICIPLTLKDKTVGVLYHDNRLLSNAFSDSDLGLLSYFAALACFALDNAKAYKEIRRLNQKISEESRYYEDQHLHRLHFEEIIGESPAIIKVLSQINNVASTDATVLILGETGVGKELVARAIHRYGPRKGNPFIQVQCSALPETLIPSELFGHEKGAFTGAVHRQIGRFELANGGTLFLDEIGDLPLGMQVRLLRTLQSKKFERVGGGKTIRSDFRLMTATNLDLRKAVEEDKFRKDLYYRLNVFPIHVPPLRERREDIPLLANYFLTIYAKKMRKTFNGIKREEMQKLIEYDWRGNVRELENIIERSCILSSEPHFHMPKLGDVDLGSAYSQHGMTLKENERRHILWALEKTGWKVRGPRGAAELLDINPSTLAFRMKKVELKRPSKHS